MTRPALPHDQRRTVKVSCFLTPAEAAKVDAARDDVPRAVWMRETVAGSNGGAGLR